MSDYHFPTDILRGAMADQLAENEDQFIFVLTNALSNICADDVIELGEMGDEADPSLVVSNLRAIIAAIEDGTLT